MAISVDVVISGKTATSVEGNTTAAVITTNLQEDKLGTKGGIISGALLPHQTDTVDLGSPSKRFLNLYTKTAHLDANSLKLGDSATISAGAGGGFSFDTEGTTTFGDLLVRNLTVTGTHSTIETTDLAIKDNIIVINSGEAGAGITLTSGGLVIDRGTLESATILFNDNTDRFEFNFPISVDGSELALVPNLIITGQTLQGQITSNDGDIVTLTTNLASTGSTVAANLITSGQTLTANLASTGTTVAANLVTSGQTLTTNLASTGTTVAANLVTSGQYLTSEVGTLSGLSVFHSMTGNFATHFTNLDDIYLAGNQGKYLKVNSAGDGLSYDLPPVTGVGGEGGGATHFTGLVDTPNGYSGIGALPEDGGLVVFNSTSEQIAYASSGAFASDADLISSGNTLDSKRDVLSGNLISSGNALDAARDTLSGNLISTGNNLENQIISNDGDIVTLTSNLISTGNTLDSRRDTLSGNLISTGNNLEAQITSNDGDISTLQTATGTLQDQKFDKVGGTLSGSVTPDASGTLNLGTRSLPFQSGYFDELWVGGNTLQIGDEASISAGDDGFSFSTTGTTTFGAVSITGDLGVSGNFTLGDTTTDKITTRGDLYVEDDAFFADAVKITGSLTVDGTASAAAPTLDTHLTTKLYVDTTGDAITTNLASTGTNLQAQITTDIANLISTGAIVDGVSGNLISSGQTLQSQITSNDSDITSLTSNLVTTGQTLTTTTDTISGSLITSGQTLQTQITSNDSDISSLTTNLASTGSTLAADIVTVSGLTFGNDNTIATITSNLVSTGQTLTTEINTVSGLITSNDGDITALQVATGALKVSVDSNTTNIASNDSDIVTLTSNLISTGTIVDDISGNLIASGQTLTNLVSAQDVSVISGNLITTGQTLQTQITSNDGDVATLTSNLITTGQTLTTNINAVSDNLISTGAVVDDVSGNLITTGQTLQTQITSNDSDVATLTTNLISTGQSVTSEIAIVSGLTTSNDTDITNLTTNLVTTGQTLQAQITSNDSDISTLTSDLATTDSNLITTGQTIQTQITSNDSDISTLDSTTVKLTSNQTIAGNKTFSDTVTITNLNVTGTQTTISATNLAIKDNLIEINSGEAGAGITLISGGITINRGSADNANILFDDSTDQFELNFPIATEGNLVATAPNLISTGQILQAQTTTLQGQTGDYLTEESTSGSYSTQFNVTAGGGVYSLSEITAGSHTTTSQVQQLEINLQRGNTYKFTTDASTNGHPFIFVTQGNGGAYTYEYTSGVTNSRSQNGGILYFRVPQSAPSSLAYACGSHASMGANVKIYDDTGNFIDNSVTGQFASDSDISTLTSNLISTGQTLRTDIGTVSGLITSNDTELSSLRTATGSLQTQVTSNDSDITSLTTNLITTGQTLQTQITSNDSDVSTLTTNLVTTGQTLTADVATVSGLITSNDTELGDLRTATGSLQTQVTSNDGDISTLTTNLIATGQTLQVTGHLADTTTLESFAQGLNVGTSSDIASRKLHVVGDVEISGTIYQSGSVFVGGGGGGGGGGGSSTFIGLADTPSSFTAGKYLSVNSAGTAIEMVNTIQSGFSTIDQGYFTGFSLAGAATGIVQNASGSVAGLDLADNKWDVSVIEEFDSVGDADYSSGTLLLHLDGINGSTSTTDDSSSSHAVTFNSDAHISTDESRFGGSSVYFDGAGDSLTLPASSDWNWGTNDFTIEFWLYLKGASRQYLTGPGTNTTTHYHGIGIDFNSVSTNKLGIWASSNGTSWDIINSDGGGNGIGSTTVTQNTWHHIAYVRSGSSFKLYLDGAQEVSVTSSASVFDGSGTTWNFSRCGYLGGTLYTNGYMDEIRITKGVARYTAAFTPPTAPFKGAVETDVKYIGQVGGWDDADVDYGIKKLSSSELSVKKMSTDVPDRLYVNVQKLGAIGQGVGFNQLFTGDGTTTNYLLSDSVPNTQDLLVSVQGFVQTPNIDYTLAGNTGVSFTTGVTSGDEISLRYLALGPSGAAGATGPAGSAPDLTASGFALNTNLVATGAIVDDISGNLITSGQTLQTQITSNDGDITSLTSNLITTGQTLQTQITSNDSDISTLTTNLVTTGQSVTSEIAIVSGLTTSNDTDIATLTTNLVTTGQTLQTQITSNDSDISTLTSNLITTGQTLQVTGHLADTTVLESFSQGLNVGTSNDLASRKLHVVGDIEISGTIYQSGSVFEGGGGGGGGGGSSTFVGLSDTPGSFTANRILSVNSAGNAVETAYNVSTISGHQSVDQGYFTGFSLAGTATGIVQNASGSVAGLNLADNKWDVSIVEESDSQAITGDANWSSVKLLLPFDGSNGATSTTDSSSSSHTVTLNSSTISTTQSKWGGSSLDLTGSTHASIPYSSDFDFGSGDFTVECWIRPNAQAHGYFMAVNDNTTYSGWAQAVLYVGVQGSGVRVQGGSYDSSMKWTAYGSEIALNTWHHVALVRYNNKVYLYVNGTATDSGSTVSGALRNNSQPVLIGRRYSGADSNPNVYIDDFRISKGLARYTANFTPTTEAFVTVINTVDTKYISQIGGWDDTDVDYGIKKISNSELSVKKMGADDSSRPIDRLYVNVQKLGAIGQGVGFNQIFTGDGTTTNYLLSDSVPNARDLLVVVEGMVQSPTTDYTLLGNTGVSFTTGVPSGQELSVRYLALGPSGAAGAAGAAGGVNYSQDIFTGNGVVSGFSMGRTVSNILETTVFINGLAQISDTNYFVNGTGLTFASGDIASGDLIMVRHIY